MPKLKRKSAEQLRVDDKKRKREKVIISDIETEQKTTRDENETNISGTYAKDLSSTTSSVDVNVKVDQGQCRPIVQGQAGLQPNSFNNVDLNWQVQKCLDINTMYHAGLNIVQNLNTSPPSQIDCPGTMVKIKGDGSCFFRCISYLLCGDQCYHSHLRQVLLLHMCSNSQILSSLLPTGKTMSQYISQSKMSENKTWATQIEIISMAHLLRTNIYTYSKYGTEFKWLRHSAHSVDNNVSINQRSIYLDHHTGCHFDVVISMGRQQCDYTHDRTLLWSEVLKQASLAERKYNRHYKQIQRSNDAFRNREKGLRNQARKRKRSETDFKAGENESRNRTRKVKRSDISFKAQEYESRNRTRKVKRSDISFKAQEYESRNRTRKVKRRDISFKAQEYESRNRTRKVKRSDISFRAEENESKKKSQRVKRSCSDFKVRENENRNRNRKVKRSDKNFKAEENESRNITRRLKRSDVHFKQRENEIRNITRGVKRSVQDFITKEYSKRKKWRSSKERKEKERSLQKASRKTKQCRISSLGTQIQIFQDLLRRGDDFVCTSCQQTFYQHSVYTMCRENLIKKGISQKFLDTILTNYKTVSDTEWICKTCYSYVLTSRVPPVSIANGFSVPLLPNHLSSLKPTETEERCTALRIPFMQLKQLGVGKQLGIYGNTVNVPMDPSTVISSLPRRFEDTQTIHLQFKRRLQYKSVLYHETVRPKVIYDLAKYFIENSDLYKEEGITLDSEWYESLPHEPEVSFASEEDLNCLETEQADLEESEEKDSWNELTEEEQAGSGNKDTMLQNTDFTDDGVHALQIAPGEKNHPLGLFMDTYAEEKSFPVLFAGQRRCQDTDRKVPVKYSSICKAELRNVNGKFAQSVPNIFFKLKKLQALQVKNMATTALRKSKNVSFTAADLKSSANIKEILQHDDGFRFLKQLRSSPPYYQSKQKELFAMINQLGLPTFFATFSAAETRWTDLLHLLCKKSGKQLSEEEISNLNWMEKCELIQKDPKTCARHFHYRTQLFLNNILKHDLCPIGKLLDFFLRIEFQQRGSPHLHCLFWIKNAPVYGANSDKEVLEFIDSNISTKSNVEEGEVQFVQLQVHRHSKSCKKRGRNICRYGFPLPPMKESLILEPIDASTSADVLKRYKQHYANVIKVLNSLSKDEEMEFDQFLEKCGLTYDDYILAIRSSIKKKQIFLRRAVQDIRVNAHNMELLKIWQANCDLQYVLDPWAVCVYIASYVMKSQRGMSQLLQNAAEEAKKGNVGLRDKVKLIANKFLNHCEVSAQEAIYLLLQLPLVQSSRDVIFINTSIPEKRVEILKPLFEIQQLPDESTDVTCTSLIDRYSQRPNILEDISLAEFASSFERRPPTNKETAKEMDIEIDSTDNNVDHIVPGTQITLPDGYRLVRRSFPKIIRYVKFDVRKDPELYYREQLMLFSPFREESELMGSSTSYEQQYKLLHVDIEKERQRFQCTLDGIEEVMNHVAEECVEEEMDEIAPVARQSEEEASLAKEDQASFLQPPDAKSRRYDIGLDIGGSDKEECVIRNRITDEQFAELTLSLNEEQKRFFYKVLHQTKTSTDPYFYFLSGGAGVGKSHVLKALYQALVRYFDRIPGEDPDDMKVVMAASTGKAAYNVRGNTLHSLFNIPPNRKLSTYQPLDHSTLNTLRCRFFKLKVLIIDEVSMVGVNLFNFISCRLQQIFDSTQPFGGISLILVGDLFQLRPVGDSWIFQNDANQYGPLMRNNWQDLVKMYELTTVMRQKDDAKFAHCLNRIRECKQTQDDVQLISSRLSQNEDQTKYTHLYSRNSDVDDYNSKVLAIKNGQSFVSVASDYTQGDISSSAIQSLLQVSKELALTKTQNLSYELTLKESANYMLTHNINTSDGLTNGATCEIMFVQSLNNKPSVVWVSFAEDDVGIITRDENRHLYHFSSKIQKTWTPILKVQKEFQIGKNNRVRVVRKQFPLKPAEAITIHKAQGSTLDKAAISFKGTIQKHMVYVALSRLRSLEGLCLLDFDPKKISVDPLVMCEMDRLRNDCLLCCGTSDLPLDSHMSVICHNARSLHKHIDHYRADTRLSKVDVLVLQETWAEKKDSKSHYLLEGFQDPICVYTDTKQQRPHSGTFIYVKTGNTIMSSHQITKADIEGASFVVSKEKREYEIISVYCHPPGNTAKICSSVKSLKRHNLPTVITGDFNIDHLQPSKCKYLKEFIDIQYKAKPVIHEETTDNHTALDQIYSTESNTTAGVFETNWSDHKMVWAFM